MSVVFTDSFTVGADTGIASYPSGTPNYAYNNGSLLDLTVVTARGRVETPTSGTNYIARIINAAVPTGDQQITITAGVDTGNNARGACCVRCKSDGTGNLYLGLIDTGGAGNTIKIYRMDNGSFTLLATSSTFTITTGAHTLLMKALGTGSQVDLTLTYDGTNTVTYSDTNANRKTTGTPGLSIWAASVTTNAYVDSVSVDNLITGVLIPPPNLTGNFQDLTGGLS